MVLIEKGPFVVWGSMMTMRYPRLMYKNDRAATADNGIIIRAGEALGGGTAVNIDLAFSPLESTIQARINAWIEEGLMDSAYSTERLATAYDWVRAAIGTRLVAESEINNDNRASGTARSPTASIRRSTIWTVSRSAIRPRRSMTSGMPPGSPSIRRSPIPRTRSV